MAAISITLPPCAGSSAQGLVSSARKGLLPCCSLFSRRNLFGKSIYSSSTVRGEIYPLSQSVPLASSESSRASHTFDVVIVGAGIIGLTIARQLLLESNLSVAVVDAAEPCAGATGAGQGYIWMIHKTPGTDIWELALRSHKLWEMLTESLHHEGMNPFDILGWKKTGSLLVGRTPDELAFLRRKVQQLSKAGLRAKFLSSSDLLLEEPALMLGNEGGAAFVPDDCQLDARRTVSYIEMVNRQFMSDGRYSEFFNEPVTSLLRSDNSGEVKGVQTTRSTLYSRRAVVVAAGCWSGLLMHDLLRSTDMELTVPVKPRKGYLLVIHNFNSFKLNHGLMEVGYVDHLTASTVNEAGPDLPAASISMTATMDTSGNLVLGSSRQFVGFGTEVDESIIKYICKQAGEFFPTLREMFLRDLNSSREVRIGLRPYVSDGKPVIGPISGISNLILATGHEGGGILLALGTAEMVTNMVLGNPSKLDHRPYAFQGRF